MNDPKNSQLISPKYDVIFKSIFSEQDVIIDFLRAILGVPQEESISVTIRNTALNARTPQEKISILDLRVEMTGKAFIDVEIQLHKTQQMKRRLVYYQAKMTVDQLERGDHYAHLLPSVVIVITDFDFIDDSDSYHNSYMLFDRKTGSLFTDLIRYDTLELKKLPTVKDGSAAWGWMKFFTVETMEELDMVAKESAMIGKAASIVVELSADERARAQAEFEEKCRRDYNSMMSEKWADGEAEGLAKGIAEGIAEGIAKGRTEGILETARRMKAENFEGTLISKITGLSAQEIQSL